MTDHLSLIEYAKAAPLEDAERVVGIAGWIVKARREAVSIDRGYVVAGGTGDGQSSVRACAIAVLRKQMNPMTPRAITDGVQAVRPCSIETVRSMLSRLSRRGVDFSKAGTGRYGLMEWTTPGASGKLEHAPVPMHGLHYISGLGTTEKVEGKVTGHHRLTGHPHVGEPSAHQGNPGNQTGKET